MENRIVLISKIAAYLAILWAATQAPPLDERRSWAVTENPGLSEENVLAVTQLGGGP